MEDETRSSNARTMGADSSIDERRGVRQGGRVKLLGEPRFPPKLVRALFLLLLRACCWNCSTRKGRPGALSVVPKQGTRSQRIALEADIAIIDP